MPAAHPGAAGATWMGLDGALEPLSAAADFSAGNARAKEFPGGFTSIASSLIPGNIWVAWEYLEPGHDAGMSFNGLVYVPVADGGGRFTWFPKPWKFIDF
jgi:hypothetical protein